MSEQVFRCPSCDEEIRRFDGMNEAVEWLERPSSAVPLETMIEEMTEGERQVRIMQLGGIHTASLYAMGGVMELSVLDDSVREAVSALYAAWRERDDGI